MNTHQLLKAYLLGVYLVVAGYPVAAATVYQWTDENGIVHFSDAPPPGGSREDVRQIVFEDYEPANPETQGYSIIDQARHVSELRQQQTAQRLAEKKLELEAQRLANELEISRMQLNEQPHAASQASPDYAYPTPYQYQNRRPLLRDKRFQESGEFTPSKNINPVWLFPRVGSTASARRHRNRDWSAL